MRKHFLLLFLMALLPLAGWAQTDLSDGWAITFDPTSPQTYTGNDLLPTVKLTHTTNPEITTGFNVVWKNENGVVVTEAKNVGWYEATVTGDMSTTYGELATPSKKFYILKATPTVSTVHALMGTVAYDGEEHPLVTTAPVYTFGTVEYSLDEETWSTEIPTAKKVGTYTVYSRVQGTDNWIAVASAALTGTAEITGENLVANTDYTAPTALAAAISFDNANHALANAGAALTDKCTMKYSLDGTNWQTTVPEAKDAGSYTVRWKAEAIDGYIDATGTLTATTISAAAPTVTRATGATELTYAGVAQSLLSAPGTATIGATPVYTIAYKATAGDSYGAAGDPIAYADVKGTKAGYYQITTKVVAGGNYLASEDATKIEVQIGKAELTVITDNKTKAYGENNPVLTASYTGFQNGETATVVTTAPTLTTTATATSAVGTYKITATEGSAAAENYTFVYNEANYGNLTITQKELNETDFSFVLDATEKVYTGEALTKTIVTANATYNGTTALTSPADYTFVHSNNTDAGTANVIISGQGNYKGSIVLHFTIAPKPVYIQPKAASKAYGAAEPALTAYDLTATAGGAAIDGATLNGTVELARVAGENVGSYKIYVKSFTAGDAGNYTIATAQVLNDPDNATENNRTALFTIAPEGEGLVLKFKDDIAAAKTTKVYGEANPTWTVADLEYVSGLVGDDDAATVMASLSAPTFELTSEDVDDDNQVILTGGLVSANYPVVTVQPMDFEVTARPITVTVNDQTIQYGNALTAAAAAPGTNWSVTTGTIHGTDVLGISFNTVNALLTYGVADDPYEDAITATITNDNYDLTVVNGDLTVNAGAAITLTRDDDMDALISAYDGQNINVTLNRNISRTEAWFAMVLPFDVTMSELVTKFGYCVVNVLDESNPDPSKVKFKLAFSTIAANQPFLVKLSTAITAPVDFGTKDVVYDAAPVREDAAGNKFHGVFKSTDLAANANYWVMVPAEDKFKKLDAEGTTLTPINCYLETAEELDAFARSIFVEEADGTVTAINAVNVDGLQKNNEGWYTIGGVKLQSAPTEKGVYIKDGKKFVIK